MTGWASAYRQVYGVAHLVMNNFSLTLDNPATFTGVTSNGYEVISRAGEFSATLDVGVKYDTTSKTFLIYLIFKRKRVLLVHKLHY